MLFKFLFAQLILARVSQATVQQTCVWSDGSVATGFLPCGNSTVTSGSCCSAGEACLASGLCYGSIGLVYRGACINTWGGGDCPTYCDDISGNWVNLLPCPYANSGSSEGPASFWCGADGTTACVASNQSHFITINPSTATRLLTSSSSTSTASSTSTGTSLTSSSSSSSATTTSSSTSISGAAAAATTSSASTTKSSNNGTAIGLGVGLGVLFIAGACAGFWAFRSYRRQKAEVDLLKASVMQHGDPPVDHSYYEPALKPETNLNVNTAQVYSEADAGIPVNELDAGYVRRY